MVLNNHFNSYNCRFFVCLKMNEKGSNTMKQKLMNDDLGNLVASIEVLNWGIAAC